MGAKSADRHHRTVRVVRNATIADISATVTASVNCMSTTVRK